MGAPQSPIAHADSGRCCSVVRESLCTALVNILLTDDKLKVQRISGNFGISAKSGLIPVEKVTLTPARFVPIHVHIAEKMLNEHACLHAELDKFPYFSAGPNSRTLSAKDVIYVKEVDAEHANVTVYDEHGKHSGFGKIPTVCLLGA